MKNFYLKNIKYIKKIFFISFKLTYIIGITDTNRLTKIEKKMYTNNILLFPNITLLTHTNKAFRF